MFNHIDNYDPSMISIGKMFVFVIKFYGLLTSTRVNQLKIILSKVIRKKLL